MKKEEYDDWVGRTDPKNLKKKSKVIKEVNNDN